MRPMLLTCAAVLGLRRVGRSTSRLGWPLALRGTRQVAERGVLDDREMRVCFTLRQHCKVDKSTRIVKVCQNESGPALSFASARNGQERRA